MKVFAALVELRRKQEDLETFWVCISREPGEKQVL